MDTAALPITGKAASDSDGEAARARRSRQLLERSQHSALAALAAVNSYLGSDEDLPAFFGRLSAAVAELTGARRAAFWRIGGRGTFALQPAPWGFASDSNVHHVRRRLGAKGEEIIERIVSADDLELVKGTSPALDSVWRELGLTEASSSIAAAWRAGERRIGAVAVYDAADGFTDHDLWVLRLVGIAAGLLWQFKESEDNLGRTAARLEQAMAARRQLLNNIAAGGDEARRRFASALHDDSLQLLTGAELQLERLRSDANAHHSSAQLELLGSTLRRVEDSLRRLLIDVSPEPPQLPSDLREGISERLESMRIRAGIETHIDSRLRNDIPPAIQAIVMKNLGEALNNVEKHARATSVTVLAETVDGGVRVVISDNGTGFVAAESVRIPGHIGLVAMRERAQLAGGWCHVESEPGTGTKIEFWIPGTGRGQPVPENEMVNKARQAELQSAPAALPAKAKVNVLVVDDDATKRFAQLETLVEERTIALTAINRELDAFSYSVSHDLRGPLVSFDDLSEKLLEKYGTRLDAGATEYLQKMREASSRMMSVFDGLQLLFRLTSGEIKREEVDVSALGRQVVDGLKAENPDRNVEVTIAPDITASADQRLVRILLTNLINNAWKFTVGKKSPKITVGRDVVDGESRIFVRDNGAGFDMIEAHRLFGAFQRLHSQSDFPGAGIGLATARRIVNRHGGRIWAEGAVGQGATFYFSL